MIGERQVGREQLTEVPLWEAELRPPVKSSTYRLTEAP